MRTLGRIRVKSWLSWGNLQLNVSIIKFNTTVNQFQKINTTIYSRYYAKACNEWRGPSPRLGARAKQLRRNVSAVASRYDTVPDLTSPEIVPRTPESLAVPTLLL